MPFFYLPKLKTKIYEYLGISSEYLKIKMSGNMWTVVEMDCLMLLRDDNFLKLLLPVFITLKMNAEDKNRYKIGYWGG